MKLGIFADSHYSSAEVTCKKRYNSASLEKIRQAFEHFQKEECDFVICLGDLIDKEDSHKKEIANLKKVEKFSAAFSGALQVNFKNGYVDYVSRRNLKNVKERLGI